MSAVTTQTKAPGSADGSSAVPLGYKRTDVGVIPEDWGVVTAGEIGIFGRGRVISHREIRLSKHPKYPVYSSQTSNEGVMGYLDTYDFEGEYITWTTDGVNAGKVFYRNKRFNCTNVCGTIKVRYDNAKYVSLALEIRARRYVSTNLANPKLMNGVAKQIVIPLPCSKEEQRAISEALSDVDGLLGALEMLIAKKRAIKQAAMQQLLTGKTRLPGFSGEWAETPLDELATITMGQSPPSKFYNVRGDGLPLIQGNADIDNRRTIGRVWTTQAGKRCRSGDLLLTVRAPVGAVGISISDACLGRGVCGLKPLGDDAFLFHALVHAEPRWKLLEQGSTFTSANSRQVAQFTLNVPENEVEQTAIATVLSDMDAEIAALERRRDKTQAIKQGMMQQLLTGRVRLVDATRRQGAKD